MERAREAKNGNGKMTFLCVIVNGKRGKIVECLPCISNYLVPVFSVAGWSLLKGIAMSFFLYCIHDSERRKKISEKLIKETLMINHQNQIAIHQS